MKVKPLLKRSYWDNFTAATPNSKCRLFFFGCWSVFCLSQTFATDGLLVLKNAFIFLRTVKDLTHTVPFLYLNSLVAALQTLDFNGDFLLFFTDLRDLQLKIC